MGGKCKRENSTTSCYVFTVSQNVVMLLPSHKIICLLKNIFFSFGQPIRVNWAYASGQREDTTGSCCALFLIRSCIGCYSLMSHMVIPLCLADHFHIFVGDLSPEVTDSALFAFFSGFASCS
jgi:hypothetical protein